MSGTLDAASELLRDLAERRASVLHLHLTRAIERAKQGDSEGEIALRATVDAIHLSLVQLRARDAIGSAQHIAGDVLFNCAFYHPSEIGNAIESLKAAQREAIEWRRQTMAPIISHLCRGERV